MCSQMDDPTQYDAPEPTRPRAYVLSGSSRNSIGEPQPSIALAVIGDMLEEADALPPFHDYQIGFRQALLEARERVSEAEAKG